MCRQNFRWCRWGAELRVKHVQTLERGPPSVRAQLNTINSGRVCTSLEPIFGSSFLKKLLPANMRPACQTAYSPFLPPPNSTHSSWSSLCMECYSRTNKATTGFYSSISHPPDSWPILKSRWPLSTCTVLSSIHTGRVDKPQVKIKEEGQTHQ